MEVTVPFTAELRGNWLQDVGVIMCQCFLGMPIDVYRNELPLTFGKIVKNQIIP